jgi:hypothetical protein
MRNKARKAIQRSPRPGTAEHDAWRRKVSAGMRRAKRRRRAAGLLSLMEVAVGWELPLSFVKRKADDGELEVIRAGHRRYIRSGDALRVFGKRRENAA